jgi:hypothetical protein
MLTLSFFLYFFKLLIVNEQLLSHNRAYVGPEDIVWDYYLAALVAHTAFNVSLDGHQKLHMYSAKLIFKFQWLLYAYR